MVQLCVEEQSRFLLALEKYIDLEEVPQTSLVAKVELGVVSAQEYTQLRKLAASYTNSEEHIPLDADFQGEKLMVLERYWKHLLQQLYVLSPDKAEYFELCVRLLCDIRDGKATEIDLYQVERFEESLENIG